MARIVIKSLSGSNIALPYPVSRSIQPGQELIIDGVEADEYKVSESLNTLIKNNLITVKIQEDPNIDDTLETEPLAGTANEAITLVGGGGGDSEPFYTEEALSFSIDYNDPGAFDGTIDVIFNTQASIDAFLTAQGATSFKYIMDCWRALPVAKMHRITMNLAAGVHRPKAGEPVANYAWNFNTVVNDATPTLSLFGRGFGLTLQGPALVTGSLPSNWEAISNVETKQTYSGATYENPYITVVGTPFTPGALAGYWALGNNWSQPVLIHGNTNNTLNLVASAPSASFTTVQVIRPSCILRNSFDDITRAYIYTMFADFPGELGGTLGTRRTFELHNVSVEPFNASYGVQAAGATFELNRVCVDLARQKDLFNVAFSGSAIGKSLLGGVDVSVSGRDSEADNVSVRGTGLSTTPVYAGRGIRCSNSHPERIWLSRSYLGGLANGVSVDGAIILETQGVVISDCSGYGVVVAVAGSLEDRYTSPAIIRFLLGDIGTVIKNCAGGFDVAHARLVCGSSSNPTFFVRFGGLTGPAFNVREYAELSLAGLNGIVNRIDTNSDYGFRIVGPFAHVRLPPNTTVSGTLGEVLLDGTPTTYAALVSSGPVVGATSVNRVEKAT